MSGNKCPGCGSTEIETDPSRGDAVCTGCGFVLEEDRIVSETAFDEGPTGNMMMIGQFVSSESTGGATGFGASYHVNGKESREITIQNARKGISNLCQQLRLNKHCIDTSVNFYKMALARHLTRGRKQAHNHAACVYITCRTEKTEHLLIDISDVLQIDVHELGRTYLRFTKALCINIPSMDPCLYILRFANKLEFGKKTHEVSMTAIRLVQRMMRDSIHSGRRPSGLCGAALLIAARLHEFNRTPSDIIKIVQVHESTLRKRLIEFGDTPSSALTLDEFMTVDLEEEQDPPAFKAARKKDRERLQKLENIDDDFYDLQSEIDKQLDEQKVMRGKRKRADDEADSREDVDTNEFIKDIVLDTIEKFSNSNPDDPAEKTEIVGLGPDIASMGLTTSFHEVHPTKDKVNDPFESSTGEIDLTDLDDEELDDYILSEKETSSKTNLWNHVNASYLEQQKEKEEKEKREKEEGKPEKKKRKTGAKKKNQGPANSAGEAIEKMLQEKRISTKINYEVLKSLNIGPPKDTSQQKPDEIVPSPEKVDAVVRPRADNKPKLNLDLLLRSPRKSIKAEMKTSPQKVEHIGEAIVEDAEIDEDIDDYIEDEEEAEIDPSELGARALLAQQNGEEEYYDYDEGEEY